MLKKFNVKLHKSYTLFAITISINRDLQTPSTTATMDALIASAGPMSSSSRKAGPSRPRRPNSTHKTVDRGPDKESIDPSTHSILNRTRLPSSFHHSSLPTGGDSAPIRPDASVARIADKKLRAKIARQDVGSKRARMERDDVNEWLNTAVSGGAGGIEVDEEEGERTWRIDQKDIVKEVGRGAGAKRFDLKFDNMGSYKVDYTRNGRHIAIASSLGHVATFDWQAGKLLSEIQLKETVRDIKFLQSESFYAVAQKKYVFMYDQDGVELHKLKQHIDVTHLQFLPYHYLLASIGHAGYLKYHDISTGVLLTQIPTHLGSPSSFAQNPHSAILHAGHQNGTMTLWSPNLTTPHVKLLAHRGPVTGIAVDPSEHSAGRYVSTAGLDGLVKLWDGRMWGKEVRTWGVRNTPSSMSYSQRGMLAVGGKSGVTIYRGLHSSSEGKKAPTPYLTLPLPGLTPSNISFCPYDDVLGVGHGKGVSSLLVPGSGEPNFDSAEQDVYETKTRRREREVRGVMDKIRPELITLDTEFLGKVDTEQPKGTYAERESRSFRQMNRLERLQAEGKAEDTGAAHARAEEEEDGDEVKEEVKVKEKYKARGKSGSMKKYLKKKKKNVIDPSLLAMRQKVASQKKADDERKKIASGELVKETGALARFG